jgi:hypothetical protein
MEEPLAPGFMTSVWCVARVATPILPDNKKLFWIFGFKIEDLFVNFDKHFCKDM